VFLLAFHIVAVGIIVVAVWGVAYRLGYRAGERHTQRRLGVNGPAGQGHAAATSSSSEHA